MKKAVFLFYLVCLFILSLSFKATAQLSQKDSSSQQNAMTAAVGHLYSTLGNQSGLYNGPEYYFYDPLIKSNAYFMDVNAFSNASVDYDGNHYNNVPIIFDIYSDKVVVLLYNKFSKFSLIKEKVKGFDFLDHHFVNISGDSLKANSEIKAGYYEQLYGGKLIVLIKHTKTIQASAGGVVSAEKYFVATKDYYLKKGAEYYKINGESALLNALSDRKADLKQYIKANQIKFRRELEDTMMKIATYYDHITN